jgi:tetratricopeptide (TPR) repeat protein/outer membrane protein OmpA-like peptidoglycan-associated protein
MRLLLFLLLFPALLSAQSLKTYERAGDKALSAGNWNAAAHYYSVILKQDKLNRKVLYKHAICAVEMSAYQTAETMLQKLNKDKKQDSQLTDLQYFIARAYQGQGKYQEAIDALNKYQGTLYKQEAEAMHASLQWAVAQKPDSKTFVVNPGKNINSAYSDFAPAMLGDTLLYSSYRFNRKKNKDNPQKKWTKVLTTKGTARSREATRIFKDQDSVHIAHTAFFPNGHYMVYTQCRDTLDAIRCDLYLTARDDRGRWLPGHKLPEGVNATGYTTTQPHVANDSNDKPVLYFASDRPGGLGKLDLYVLPLDTTWFCDCKAFGAKNKLVLPAFGKCQPVSNVNTPLNDATPHIHAPTQTLYWSTDGRPGFGGYDVFKAKLDGSGIENIGAPLNSSYNDLYFMATDSLAQNGWLASNRTGSQYLNTANKACCFDLWQWKTTPPTPTDTTTVAVNKLKIDRDGKVTPDKGPLIDGVYASHPPEKPVPPTPQERLRSFVGLPLYFDNDEPDKRTRKQTTTKTYETTASVYLRQEEVYRQKFAEGAKTEDTRADAEAEITAFFEDEVRRGYDRLFELTDLIYERLQAGERIEVMVKGFTSPRAQTDYNLQLGYRRISSVRNHFADWSSGQLKTYLASGQLTITQTSFGETTASTQASDKLEDEKNSIYNPIAARERRVEIIEIKTQ